MFVFNRGNVPVLVFDGDGNLIRRWGNPTPFEGTEVVTDPYGNTAARWIGTEYVRPHAISIDHEDNIWLTDDTGNCITKCDPFGKRLMMIASDGDVTTDPEVMAKKAGKVQQPAEKQSGRMFNRPTDVAVHPGTGDIFITDGYGNSRVHRLRADGGHILSWGVAGTDPGQFNLPHNIAIHPDGDKVPWIHHSCKSARVIGAASRAVQTQPGTGGVLCACQVALGSSFSRCPHKPLAGVRC